MADDHVDIVSPRARCVKGHRRSAEEVAVLRMSRRVCVFPRDRTSPEGERWYQPKA